MTRTTIFTALLFIISLPLLLRAQTIENVHFRQTEDDKVVITYDIIGGEGMTFEVSLSVSDDGGKNFLIIPRTVSGDVGKNVKGGRGKRITWDVLSDIRRLEGEAFAFKVTAKTAGGLELAGIEWVFVKGGSFEMGDTFGDGQDDEKPVHTVYVDDFYISKYEVTVGQFRKFVEATGYRTDAEKGGGGYIYTGSRWKKKRDANWRNPYFSQTGNHPVVLVSWNDAVAFCKWLSKKTETTIRLPTEAEWEYAARAGGQKIKYAWGNGDPYINGKKAANIADKSAKLRFTDWTIWEGYDDNYVYTAPVGSFATNGLGLYDMSGNVWEWCQDWYDDDYYSRSPRHNPQGPASGRYRVLRGGSWSDLPGLVRCSSRNNSFPGRRTRNYGFRVLRTR